MGLISKSGTSVLGGRVGNLNRVSYCAANLLKHLVICMKIKQIFLQYLRVELEGMD